MFKQLGKLMVLAIVVVTIFVSCTEDCTVPVSPSPESFDNFIAFAAMDDYSSPIIMGMKLNLPADNGDIKDSADNKTVFYTYETYTVGDNTRAVYRANNVVGNNYFGVQVLGIGNNKQLQFIFDNISNVPIFFASSTIDFDDTNNLLDGIPVEFDNFTGLAAGAGYTLPNGTTKITVSGNNIVDENNTILYTYVKAFTPDNKTHAVYKTPRTVNEQFLGVELIAMTNSRELEFYLDNGEYFTTDVIHFDTTSEEFPALDFLDNVIGKSFQLITMDNGLINKVGNDGSILGSDGITPLYTYVGEKSTTEGVYVNGSNEYFGVKLVNDTSLDFYFDNNSNVGAYWGTLETVQSESIEFINSATVLLATRTPDGAFGVSTSSHIESGTLSSSIPEVPTTGAIAALSVGTNIYVLADNVSLNDDEKGSLYTGIVADGKVTYTRAIFPVNFDNMTNNSLQAIGTDLFIAVRGTDNVSVHNSDGSLITADVTTSIITDINSNHVSVGASNATSFYIASHDNNTADIRQVTVAGIQSPIPLITSNLYPKSIVLMGTDIYVAGRVRATPKINKVDTSGVSSDITGDFPRVAASTMDLLAVEDTLFIAVGLNAEVQIYKFDSINTTWTEMAELDIPSVTSSIDFAVDGTNVYLTTRPTLTTTVSYAYKFDTVTKTLIEIAKSAPTTIYNVSPGTAALPCMGLFVVESNSDANALTYSNLVVYDLPFVMPSSIAF